MGRPVGGVGPIGRPGGCDPKGPLSRDGGDCAGPLSREDED